MTRASLKLCGYCALFVLAEVLLYASYRHHDARFHWFLHFLVGASAALLLMALIAWRRRAAAPFPLLWILAGHLLAMTPDFLFLFFSIIHRCWMDVFLLHIQAHFIPGRNLTWYLIFLLSLAAYLKVVASLPHSHGGLTSTR